MDTVSALNRCRERAAEYLTAQVMESGDELCWRHSPTHDPAKYPGHLLYGTWAGVLGCVLLGTDTELDAARRSRVALALNRHQRSDGTYAMPSVQATAGPAPEDEYHVFHCTNYAWGALRALGASPRFAPSFMKRFASAVELERWFARRDWGNSWREGNNVVNLASFFAILSEDGVTWAGERLRQMIDWHDYHQPPQTGLWHLGDASTRDSLLNAMAGAAHNLHLYYYLNRPVPRSKQIVDSCLRLGYLGVQSACIDLDVVDILVHLRTCEHRRREVDSVLERYLIELLEVQNDDGGFCDTFVTPHTLYGNTTSARVSVTWTTWFRMVAIGMAACALIPAERGRWTFRGTLGSGYCNLAYALPGTLDGERSLAVWHMSTLRRWRLATARKVRFSRQRLTWRARNLLWHG
jgi:hypothetical protein